MSLLQITLVMTLSLTTLASGGKKSKKIYITTDADAVSSLYSFLPSVTNLISESDSIAVFETTENELPNIGEVMHENHNRCGGFIVHESKAEALEMVEVMDSFNSYSGGKKTEEKTGYKYTINQPVKVKSFISQAQEETIRSVIIKLSSFQNRYFQSKTGVASSRWIASHWKKLSKSRSDVSVKLVKHKKWAQESIIMTITGSERPDEIIVIGGHADSIKGRSRRHAMKAPGADDNASGIATITEVIRVAMQMGYKPKRTVQFMGYAAEEVGLRGSGEIANTYNKGKKKVLGVIQLDMTGFHGTSNKDIVMMTDYTNKSQNQFLGALIDRYVGVAWGYSKCGYGCSDHASWHKNGYAASMPFEAKMDDMNHKIHTTSDTLDSMGGDASHSLKFAKMAIAFMVELAK